jgi:NADH-quinone oxidoreductase subunit M
MNMPWLTILTLLPVAGALILLALSRQQSGSASTLARRSAAVISLVILAFTVLIWMRFDSASGALQFEERHRWIAALHVEYRLAIDGISLLMLLLTAIVVPIGIAASWQIRRRVPLYFALVFLLQACMFGAFTALNFFHFFLFWELSLIPAFFLIRLWGGTKAARAATQFLVYTMVGSVAMLLTFLAIFLATGIFDFIDLAALAQGNHLIPAVVDKLQWHAVTPEHTAALLFAGAFLGFAVKVPLVPFHTWLPATYAEAPSGTTAILTGAMSKMGVYGFLRILIPIFAPQIRQFLTPLLWLAVASILLSAFAALAQRDLKRIFAYSSINHLGYCLLAAFAVVRTTDPSLTAEKYAALSGVLLQVFSHALIAATLFWFISLLESRTGGARLLSDFGGLRRIAPVFAGLMGIALFSSLGLPGLNGFVGEFLIFKGTFPLVSWATSVSVLGLLLTAVFILGVIQQVFTGPLNPARAAFFDLTSGERIALAPAIALMFILGLFPQLLLGSLNATVVNYVQHLGF